MNSFDPQELKKLYIPPITSHKGQNGKLMIIGGSHLFHAASLWALKVASRIVDMVFYSSVPENNEIVLRAKQEFRDGIVVPREKIDEYIVESDAVLIGSGLARDSGKFETEEATKSLTKRLLEAYPTKRWIIDAGSLTEMQASWLLPLKGNIIVTPHAKEFRSLFQKEPINDHISQMAQEYNCVILLKGEEDIVCSKEEYVQVSGGNAGMTKGGTGDVLAGLVAALYCKNNAFLAAAAGSYINKKAGDRLFEKAGYYFNASDLADEIPKVMKDLL